MPVSDATSRFWFTITVNNVAKAVRKDKTRCVVANALRSRKDVTDVLIGASVSTVTFTSGRVIRYTTPTILKDALNRWDKWGDWELPPGNYFLEVKDKPTAKYKKRTTTNKVAYYSTGRRRNPAPNPRHFEFLRKRAAA